MRVHLHRRDKMTKRWIESDFYDDPYIEEVSLETDRVYLYLVMTCQNACGIAERTVAKIARKTKVSEAAVLGALKQLEDDKKIIKEGNYILILNYLKHNWNPAPNYVRKVENELRQFALGGGVLLVNRIIERYQQYAHQMAIRLPSHNNPPIQTLSPKEVRLGLKENSEYKTSSLILSSFDESPLADRSKFDLAFPEWDQAKRDFWFSEASSLAKTKGYTAKDWEAQLRSWDKETGNRYERAQRKKRPPRTDIVPFSKLREEILAEKAAKDAERTKNKSH